MQAQSDGKLTVEICFSRNVLACLHSFTLIAIVFPMQLQSTPVHSSLPVSNWNWNPIGAVFHEQQQLSEPKSPVVITSIPESTMYTPTNLLDCGVLIEKRNHIWPHNTTYAQRLCPRTLRMFLRK